MSQPIELPRWMDVALLPAVNLAIALLVAGGVVALVGFEPLQVLALLVKGAFGSQSGISYTLYYATTFGLSMAGSSTSAARARPSWAGWAPARWRWLSARACRRR